MGAVRRSTGRPLLVTYPAQSLSHPLGQPWCRGTAVVPGHGSGVGAPQWCRPPRTSVRGRVRAGQSEYQKAPAGGSSLRLMTVLSRHLK